jgi:Na+/citrate or Na+/malate symporter
MITAHLPAGYCVFQGCEAFSGRLIPYAMAAAIIGAILPDFDLLLFYLVDNRAFNHHRYWVHIPIFWAAIAVLGFLFLSLSKVHKSYHLTFSVFLFSIFVHLCLDSIVGGIMWLYPLNDTLYKFVVVPRIEGYHWLASFIFHWTFLLELMIWFVASLLFILNFKHKKRAEY